MHYQLAKCPVCGLTYSFTEVFKPHTCSRADCVYQYAVFQGRETEPEKLPAMIGAKSKVYNKEAYPALSQRRNIGQH